MADPVASTLRTIQRRNTVHLVLVEVLGQLKITALDIAGIVLYKIIFSYPKTTPGIG